MPGYTYAARTAFDAPTVPLGGTNFRGHSTPDTGVSNFRGRFANELSRHVHSARMNAYFCYGIGVVFVIGSIFFHLDLHKWPLTLFVSAAGIGIIITGVGYMRVAKRNTEYGNP